MSRMLLVVPVALTALLTVAHAVPVPEGATLKGPVYFPTKVGAKWVYDEDGTEKIFAVVKVEEGRLWKTVYTERCLPDGNVRYQTMRVSPYGLVQLREWENEWSPPIQLLKLPPGPDTKWFPISEDPWTVHGPERVKVPAGTYDAVRVDVLGRSNGPREMCSCWYAPGVGLVKATIGEQTVKVLKSFEPGK
jgi:hypothetical protein